ncbi:hypothetical protein HMI55_004430 [Coelomomyces lativittatus]|nr:hypothetical protein HMI55_004430 [Coelomomyces lativittatus]
MVLFLHLNLDPKYFVRILSPSASSNTFLLSSLLFREGKPNVWNSSAKFTLFEPSYSSFDNLRFVAILCFFFLFEKILVSKICLVLYHIIVRFGDSYIFLNDKNLYLFTDLLF